MGKFPTFWAIVLIFALIWFSKEMGWLSYNFNFPWIPAILVIIALGFIINRIAQR